MSAPIRIGLADDEPLFAQGLAMILGSQQDFAVRWRAVHGQDARARVRRDPVDGLLMDGQMPVMDGIEATRRLVDEGTASRIVILTTFNTDDSVLRGIDAGASGFLLKDVRAAQLAHAVRAVAQGDAVLTPRVTKELIARGAPRALSAAQYGGLRERFGALTPREFDVARLIAEGMSNEEIAEKLVLQPASVRRNVSRILAKLHLRDRVQIAVAWYKSGG